MGLKHVFGEKPIPLVIDFLRVQRHWDYSLKDISEATSVSFRTLQRIMPALEREGIVVRTRTEGRAQMYMIDFECPIVKKLDELAVVSDLGYAEKQVKRTVSVPA